MKAKEFVTETINPDCFNPAFNDTQHFDGLTYRATVEEEYGKPVLTVKVLDDNFQQAGLAKFKPSKAGVVSLITSFRPEYQGQGLARNIYAYVRALGNTIVPSRNQLPAGRAMWDAWKKSGDAKHLMRDVAEVAPPGAKAERMVKHIKQSYAKDGKLTPQEKSIAFATAWKAHNAGRVEEQDVAEGKIKLSTDPNWYGAEVGDYKASGPVVNIPANRLVGFEPDDKMNQPASKANVEKIVAGLKQGAKLPPLMVRQYKNGYQVLDGHHRFWAYKLLGVKSIPAQVVPEEDIEEITKQGVAENNHWHAAGMADAERDIKRDPDRKVKKLNPRTRLKTMQYKQARHPEEAEQYSLGYRSINPAESICSLAEAHEIFDDFEQAMAERGLTEDAFDSVTDEQIIRETAAWRRKAGKSAKGGLNRKGVASYRRENPGSKLQMAVTTKPSKLKPGSKAAKRRKSFCARMSGVKGPMKKPNGKPTRKALALRKWNC